MITVTMFGLAAVADDAWLRVVRRTSQQCIARLRKRKTINDKRKTSGAAVAFRSDAAKRITVCCTVFRFLTYIRKTMIVCL